MQGNGLQNTALTRLAVVLALVLTGEATATIPTSTRAIVAATMQLSAAAPFPLGPYFM